MLLKRIPLYESADHPYLDTYILDQIGDAQRDCDTERGAVIVVPGGGYSMTSDREGEPVAMKFAAAGYHTFVLWYRVAPAKYTDPLEDLARAVAMVRANAKEWRVDPDDISVCGFSAGGHLAASLGVFWDKPFLSELVGVDKACFRPNRMLLAYPVITSDPLLTHAGSMMKLTNGDKSLYPELSLEKQVGENTPPTFLWHCADDMGVPVENSLLFATSLSSCKVPFELHVFQKGMHGQSVAEEHVFKAFPESCAHDCAIWTELAVRWLKHTRDDLKK